MSKTIEISRELAERLTKDYTGRPNWDALEEDRLAATEELRAILAAPAVERQELVVWASHHLRGSLAGKWFIIEGPDAVPNRQLYAEPKPLYTSPPAPVADKIIVDQKCPVCGDPAGHMGWVCTKKAAPVAVSDLVQNLEAVIAMFAPGEDKTNRTLIAARACLDKVKEMNE